LSTTCLQEENKAAVRAGQEKIEATISSILSAQTEMKETIGRCEALFD
jgi:hypothetical protein